MERIKVFFCKIIIGAFFLLSALSAVAGITNDTYEVKITGFINWQTGESFSDGKRLFCGSGGNGTPGNGKLYIFNTMPTADTSLVNANVVISGFTDMGGVISTANPCIVGNKLLVSDSDPVAGYCIRVWNSVPDTNTTVSSCNYKITGFTASPENIRTDGTKFSVTNGGGGPIWIWDPMPEGNADTSLRTAYSVDHYAPWTSWFGTSGKFYVANNFNATNKYFVHIYDSVPVGPFTMANAQATITFTSVWNYRSNVFEIRNILYVMAYHYSDAKTHAYVWKTIPTSNTDTTTKDNEYSFDGAMAYGTRMCDLHNFYVWDGDLGNIVYKYANNYDTFTMTGTNLAPSSIDQRHLDQPMEKIRIYTYPGKTVLNKIKLNLTGNCVDADVSAVKLYYDANNDGAYTSGTDALIKSGVFSGKTATLDNLDFWVDAGEKNILVTFDINADAALDHTVGVNVEYMAFEKIFYEFPSAMSSSQATIVSSIIPNWKNEVRIVYTQSQAGSDTLFTISLDWDDASGGAPPLMYKLSHLAGDSVIEQFSETASYRIFTGLETAKQHRFKVKVIDLFGNETPESNLACDENAPEWSGIFKAHDASSKNSQGEWQYKIRLTWEPAKDNTSKDVLYEVSLKEEGKDWEAKTATWENSCEIVGLSGAVRVRMKARDSAGNYTQYTNETKLRLNPFLLLSEEASIGTSGGSIVLQEMEGEKVQVDIPEGAFGRDYNVMLEKVMDGDYAYEFHIYDSKGLERKTLFKKPVTITFTYNDDKLTRIGYKEEYLHVLYFDDVKWSNIGGKVNTVANTVKMDVYHFSMYKMSGKKDTVKDVALSSEFLTPNDDEINDNLFFNINWNYAETLSIRIYDINGKQIWEYSGTDNSIVWNCRDMSNNIVESGVYLYVINVEKKTINGTVVVVK